MVLCLVSMILKLHLGQSQFFLFLVLPEVEQDERTSPVTRISIPMMNSLYLLEYNLCIGYLFAINSTPHVILYVILSHQNPEYAIYKNPIPFPKTGFDH